MNEAVWNGFTINRVPQTFGNDLKKLWVQYIKVFKSCDERTLKKCRCPVVAGIFLC